MPSYPYVLVGTIAQSLHARRAVARMDGRLTLFSTGNFLEWHIMSTHEIAKAFAQAFDAHDLESLARYLSEDFVFEGVFPEPLVKEDYLKYMRALFKAFPDFSLNRKILPSTDNHVLRELVQVTGTHTGELDLPFPGWSIVPPTGTVLALPPEPVEVIFRGDKVVCIRTYEASGGDLVGILRHLGVDLPE